MTKSAPPTEIGPVPAELADAKAREAALREILRVISQSRADEGPVFDVILKNAARLCHANSAGLQLVNDAGTHFRITTSWGGDLQSFELGEEIDLAGPTMQGQAIREGRTVHIKDLKETALYKEGYPPRVRLVDGEGVRTTMIVPLIRDDAGIGCISLSRPEVRPFDEDEITLVETFAEQAVIAIENVRQFREVQTRLERETATSDVLQVISESRADHQRVFDTLLDRAVNLLDSDHGSVWLMSDDGAWVEPVARNEGGAEINASFDRRPMDQADSITATVVREARMWQTDDLQAEATFADPDHPNRVWIAQSGARSILIVPLVSNGTGIGLIAVYRRHVAPYSADHVALLQSFAAQAVIAIENVRQFREVQERLERERASSEVLDVISRSRDDDAPVFDVVLRNARRLCGASTSALLLGRPQDEHVTLMAVDHADADKMARTPGIIAELNREPMKMDPEAHVSARAICTGEVVQIADLAETESYRNGEPSFRTMVDVQGNRAALSVPLLDADGPIGAINLHRQEPGLFAPDQVALMQSFAAQAVIAIENVRQFREVQERLARETATRQVLYVISQSRDDEQPVFDLIVKLSKELCNAMFAGLVLGREGDELQRVVASENLSDDILKLWKDGKYTMQRGGSLVADAILDCKVASVEDMGATHFHAEGDERYRVVVTEGGVRSNLLVPLVLNGKGIGCLMLGRDEVRPYTPDQVRLIETFAEQAVIAIENVRQFQELQTRLEREAATREILEVISNSRDDELPVLETIVRNAARLCDAHLAGLSLVNEARSKLIYSCVHGPGSTYFRTGFEFDLSGPVQVATTVREARTIHTPDLKDDPLYLARDPVRVAIVEDVGVRTFLTVPLIKDGVAFGCLNLNRQEVRAFTDDEIALIETFAAQAVIAIENVRQFRELQDRLERERASSEVLDVISRSRDDDLPVFQSITRSVARLCKAPLAYICVLNEARTHVAIPAQIGARPEFAERLARFNEPVESDYLFAVEATLSKQMIRFDDLSQTELYRAGNEYRRAMVDEEGMRSVLVVPLVLGEDGVGCIVLYRREVAPFSDAEVDLVHSFAAQAVIAIENVRQFREVQERLQRERASAEVLQVISQSRDNERPVFDAILSNAARLCRAPMAWLLLLNADRSELRLAAYHGPSRRALEIDQVWPMTPERTSTGLGQALMNALTVQDEDLTQTQLYRDGDPGITQLVDEEGLRTRVSVPLVRDGQSIGAIVLSRREVLRFSEDDIRLADTFAGQAVIAIENVRQFKALEEQTAEVVALNADLEDRVETQVDQLERLGRLKRFLSPQVADAVVSSGENTMLGSHRAMIAILFCDIRGFTAFCESAEPEEAIEVLQTYHEALGKLIHQAGAGFDHRAGDGIMAIFNDPIACDDPAGDALRCAIAMRDCMADLCSKWRKLGHRLGFGVGISLGYATVGMVGFEGRYDYTASGTAVNLGSRLCDQAEDGEILLSPRAALAVEDIAMLEPAGDLTLKGFHAPVVVNRVAGLKGAI